MNRRGFIVRLLEVVGGGLAFLARPPAARSREPVFELNHVREYPPGSVTHHIIAEAFIVSDSAGLYALSSICTHRGGHLFKTDKEDAFVCRSHHSRFNLNGDPVRGPAVRSLPWLRLELSREKRVILYRAQAGERGVRLSREDGRKLPVACPTPRDRTAPSAG